MKLSDKAIKNIKAGVLVFLIFAPVCLFISEYLRNENIIDEYENQLREMSIEVDTPISFPYTSSLIHILDSLEFSYDIVVQSYTLEGETIREKTVFVMPKH